MDDKGSKSLTAQPPHPQVLPTTAYGVRDVERMAQAFAKSNLFGMKSVDQAFALCLIAQAEGKHPAMAAQDYDIIQNRPAKKSQAMLRDFLASGGKVEWHELTDVKADATFSHPAGGTVRIDWDMDRAKRAGLSDRDIYRKYPRQMLKSRVVSDGVRTVYPGATGGMYVPEEVEEFRDVTPPPRAKEAAKTTQSEAPQDKTVDQQFPPQDRPTEKQIKRLFAIAKKQGWSNNQLRNQMTMSFGKTSTSELDYNEYLALVQHLENNPNFSDTQESDGANDEKATLGESPNEE